MGSLAGPRRALSMSQDVRRNRCIGSRPRCASGAIVGDESNARSDMSGWTSFGTRRSTSVETSRSVTSSKNCHAVSFRGLSQSHFRLVHELTAARHPELFEMELDMLYAHIASLTVVAAFQTLRDALRTRSSCTGPILSLVSIRGS